MVGLKTNRKLIKSPLLKALMGYACIAGTCLQLHICICCFSIVI